MAARRGVVAERRNCPKTSEYSLWRRFLWRVFSRGSWLTRAAQASSLARTKIVVSTLGKVEAATSRGRRHRQQVVRDDEK